ncbi:MAG: hypothetical protein OXC46_10900 [Thaumarchaeota archaeon]|nr:hypothetical protein [Nitrososphaerota archaeon]
MRFSNDQVRKTAALRDELYAKIRKHQEEIEMLEGSIEVLDVVLKESSFTKASSLVTNPEDSQHDTTQHDTAQSTNPSIDKPENIQSQESTPDGKPVPITDTSGQLVANAYVSTEKISIIINQDTKVDADAHPFKPFFLERIIGGMKSKDDSEVDAGKIQKDSVISCTVERSGPHLSEIIIRNYRQKERINEIINTAGWSLARMLENDKK